MQSWRMRTWIPALVYMLMAFNACSQPNSGATQDVAPTWHADVGGFSIPLFDTATEQLNYAKTLSVSPKEKRAALKALIDRFPEDRAVIGQAKLELAYMYLGDDFRMASPVACRQALSAYELITTDFADQPAVRAKAYWYLGWIYTDLLKDKQKGLALYSYLAEKYPQDQFSRISPVPWLKTLFPYPNSTPYTADDEHTHTWAGLALLEIVRNSESDQGRMIAFEKLWQEHRNSLTTGYALKEILRHPPLGENLSPKVEAYVQGNTFNQEINKDLLAALAHWKSKGVVN